MLTVKYSNLFKKDYKLMQKIDLLQSIFLFGSEDVIRTHDLPGMNRLL